MNEHRIVLGPVKGLDKVNEKLREKRQQSVEAWPAEASDLDKTQANYAKKLALVRRATPLEKFFKQRRVLKIDRQLKLTTFHKRIAVRQFHHSSRITHYRRVLKIDRQLETLRTEKLLDEEVIGTRLYTGPMVRLPRARSPFAPMPRPRRAGMCFACSL